MDFLSPDGIDSSICLTISELLGLSPREFQLTQAIFDGMGESEMAQALRISPNTVSCYLGRIYRKVGVSGRVQLVVRIIEKFAELHVRSRCADTPQQCPLNNGSSAKSIQRSN